MRVLAVIANLITICGGQFFTRRIAKDALPLLLKLLREGPSLIMSRPSDALRPKSSKELLLLRSQGSEIQETGISPAAKLKVQLAVLKCIEMIAGHQKNSSALETTYKPIVSWVVASACRVPALQAAAAETLVALSNLDADLVWLVVADLVHGTSAHLCSMNPVMSLLQFEILTLAISLCGCTNHLIDLLFIRFQIVCPALRVMVVIVSSLPCRWNESRSTFTRR